MLDLVGFDDVVGVFFFFGVYIWVINDVVRNKNDNIIIRMMLLKWVRVWLFIIFLVIDWGKRKWMVVFGGGCGGGRDLVVGKMKGFMREMMKWLS